MSKKERVHREQPPSRAIVRFRLRPRAGDLGDRTDFFLLNLIQSNGDDPMPAPTGTITPDLIETLEANRPYVAIGDAVFARTAGPNAERRLKDGRGRSYLERTYHLDMMRTSSYRRQLDRNRD